MRALVLEDFGEFTVRNISDPGFPKRGEVGIRISFTGICGSDIHGYTGSNGRRVPGQIMGHETVGRVYALGEDVTDLNIGQTVTFNPLISCGECAACEMESQQHCPYRAVIGVDPNTVAAFAEKVVVPKANVVDLSGLEEERYGALIEPLAVALHAGKRAGIQSGDSVLVTGGGPIGQSAILAAWHLGAARVIATDISAERRELCEQIGAESIDPAAAPTGEQVRAMVSGPVDVALDAVGIDSTLSDALSATKIGGVICLVGMESPNVTIPAYSISTAERILVGSFCYGAQTFKDAASWVVNGDKRFSDLISKTVSISDANDIFAQLATGVYVPGKVLVDMRE